MAITKEYRYFYLTQGHRESILHICSLKNYKSYIQSEKIRPGQIIDLRMKNKIIVSNAEK